MLLAELGADVVRIDRPAQGGDQHNVLGRSKRSIALDLRSSGDLEQALRLCDAAHILIEGFRPGVMEALGLGPDALLPRNPPLVYGRMTGWGQTGPLAQEAGHDINYLGLSGALHALGPADQPPPPPLNLAADFGGGALYLVMGVLAALRHAEATGHGQVVDCAMTDGAASLSGLFYGLRASGLWSDAREANLLDGGAPFYRCYRCADGKFVAVGALEPRFYAALLKVLGLDSEPLFGSQFNHTAWPEQACRIAEVLATRPRDAWVEAAAGHDACLSPVLSWSEAPDHPHNQARAAFQRAPGGWNAAAAPKLSATPAAVAGPPATPDPHRAEIERDWLGA
jgi:alpha-methylacyl-CoA racemase